MNNSEFKPGDKVVAIDISVNTLLKHDHVYTIREQSPGGYIYLEEFNQKDIGFFPERFKLAPKPKKKIRRIELGEW